MLILNINAVFNVTENCEILFLFFLTYLKDSIFIACKYIKKFYDMPHVSTCLTALLCTVIIMYFCRRKMRIGYEFG